MDNRIVLIGGSNVDYMAKSAKQLIEKNSNIGELQISFGGVGRNIVENLALIGNKVTFYTGIGNDLFGSKLKSELQDIGVEVISPKLDVSSSSYLAIHDADGDMKVAICDSRAIDQIDIDFINENNEEIKSNEYICLETNISEKMIGDLFRYYPDKKWLVEGVSNEKAKRVSKYLDKVYLFKGNRKEAQSVIDSDTNNIRKNIQKILDKGAKNVVITNGSKSVYYGNKNGIDKVIVNPLTDIKNTTGAGDAMFAGVVDQICQGKELREAIIFGDKMANESLHVNKAVSPEVKKFKYSHIV